MPVSYPEITGLEPIAAVEDEALRGTVADKHDLVVLSFIYDMLPTMLSRNSQICCNALRKINTRR
jgi:hypothetical protein